MKGFGIVLIVIALLDMFKTMAMRANAEIMSISYEALEIWPVFLISGVFTLVVSLFHNKSKRG